MSNTLSPEECVKRYRFESAAMLGQMYEHETDEEVNHLNGQPLVLYSAYESLEDKIASMQARIDALMLEHCEDDMTTEQVKEWERNQTRVVVPPPKAECECSLRTKLVGDGCEKCNPAQTIEYLREQVAELEQRVTARDTDWILAIGNALGLDSGYMVPIVPKPDLFKDLFAKIREQPSPPPSGWQPIETAPKGVKVLGAYRNKLGHWRRVMMKYYGYQQLETDDSDFVEDDEGFAPEGWYEECESQENIRRTDEPPMLWHALPAQPSPEPRDAQ
jgi:hypothetical protein